MDFSTNWDIFEKRMFKFINTYDKYVVPELKDSKYINFSNTLQLKTDLFPKDISDQVMFTFRDNIRDKWLNKRFNRFKTMGRANDYNKYHTYFSYGQLIEKRRRVKLYKHSLKKLIKDNRGSFSFDNDLPLPVGKHSRIVGVYNRKYFQKYFRPRWDPNYNFKTCLRRASEPFEKFDETYSIKVLPGNWQYNYMNLVDMTKPSKRNYSYRELIDGLKSRKDIDLVLPSIPFYGPHLISNVRVNHSSSPGIDTKNTFGNKRSISTPFTKPIAEQFCRDIVMVPRNGYVVDTSLWFVGGREKRIKSAYNNPYKPAASRVTLCQEDVPTIIGQSVIVLINESLQKLAKGFNWGGRLNGIGQFLDFIEVLKPINNEFTNFSTDFVGHDNRVTHEEMVTGVSLLRCCFPECDSLDRLFYYILSSLTHKRIVLPESLIIYEIDKGLPTGHSFTSLLTTICAYMKIATAMNKIMPVNELRYTHLQGAGDDWNGVVKSKYLKSISDEINLNSGGECAPFDVDANSILANLDEGKPTFLKKNYKNGVIAWNQVELFTNYSYPTSTNPNRNTVIDDLTVMCSSGPFDEELNVISKNLIILHLYESYMVKYNAWYKRWGYEFIGNERIMKLINLAGWNFKTLIDIRNNLFKPLHIFEAGSNVLVDTLDFRTAIRSKLQAFDKKIKQSSIYMLSARKHWRWETNVRLKVFDYKKKWYANRLGVYLGNAGQSKFYLSHRFN